MPPTADHWLLMERVTLFCFAASYAVALSLELWHLYQRRPIHRLMANVFGGAGLLAHTIYLAVQRPPLGWQYGLLLALAWILAIFYLYGSVHHARHAWGIFVLPLVLVLVGLATAFGAPTGPEGGRVSGLFSLEDRELLGITHATLLILAAVGVCVGFVASLMYLVEADRLRAKALPSQGLRLTSVARHDCESVILSTCNRVELYISHETGPLEPDDVVRFLSDFHGVPADEIAPHLYVHRQTDAVCHLFRVTASLDSMIVGEAQISGQ